MLVWIPSIVVVKVGSEFIMSPFKLHVIDKGLSPLEITHVSCAKSPWFTTSLPNENGTITGISVNKTFLVHSPIITINFKFC